MKFPSSIAMQALSLAWFAALPAQAATQARTVTTPAARLCTLSIPTTDTRVRPKANGFRNEGTTNAFVICAFDSAPGQDNVHSGDVAADPSIVWLYFTSLDGLAHALDCTAVNSWGSVAYGTAPMQYITKAVAVDGDASTVDGINWSSGDYGAATRIPTSGAFSVTCLLPPGVAIEIGMLKAEEDVGN
jgi:hypothetical protein